MSNKNNLKGLGSKLTEGFYMLHGFEDSEIIEEKMNPNTQVIIKSVFKPELYYSQDDPVEMYQRNYEL